MTASSSAFMNALFVQTGTMIQDLIPLLCAGLGLVIAFLAFKIIYKAFINPAKKLFK